MRIALATACAWLAFVGSAGAATFAREPGSGVIGITSGEEASNFYGFVDATEFVFERDTASVVPLAGSGQCTGGPAEVRCPGSGVVGITFNGGGGNDSMGFDGFAVALDGTGGPGNDSIVGTDGTGTLHGGDGNDYIDGRAGADEMFGDAGDDSFAATTPGDKVDGGDGYDVLDFSNEAVGSVTVTLDGQPNDGRSGHGVNVLPTVEDVYGSAFADFLTGSAEDNTLSGAEGNDEITGGLGGDALNGDSGDDKLFADDGIEDVVNCGAGNDSARVDSIDVVSGCETVEIVGADADGDGVKPPLDCDDSNPAAKPGNPDVPGNGIDEDCSGADAPLLDGDGDGATSENDCDDADRDIRPGAVDRPGNGIDENCDGKDAPYPRAAGSLKYAFRTFASVTRADQLLVVGAARGTRVAISCRGARCRFGKKSLRLAQGGRRSLLGKTGRNFRPGTTLEIRILQPDAVAEVRTFRFRAGKSVVAKLRCLPPGAKKPTAC